ncbi:MAG: c-type cytochrome [Carboxylicivirga sp.]|jgi:YVTN family beta-propeller protein|nr:c-type cytochrome [Carboxylicivirga sp.]
MVKNIFIGLFLAFAVMVNAQEYKSLEYSVADKLLSKLYVTDATANALYVFDMDVNGVTHLNETIALPDTPTGITTNDNEDRIFITCGVEKGQLLVVNKRNQKVTKKLKLGHSPRRPVLSGNQLFVSNQFENKVQRINLSNYKVEASVSALREPFALAVHHSFNKLVVANYLPKGNNLYQNYGASVQIIDPSSMRISKSIVLPDGSNTLNSIYVDEDRNRAYVTHVLARYNVPTNQIERGWINTNALSVIDLEKDKYLCTIMLDDLDLGAANPFDVTLNKEHNKLLVTHSGTNELSIIDYQALSSRIDGLMRGETSTYYSQKLEDVVNDLSFLQDIRERYVLNGVSPKQVVTVNNFAFINSYYTAGIEKIDLLTGDVTTCFRFQQPEMTQVRQGEIYFQDATMCKQQWQSCVSCHPGGARVDALNWDLLNDGIGNPKNTKSLLNAHFTAPSMATAIRKDAKVAVRAGIEHILFTEQDDDVARAIDTYLMSLEKLPSPYLEKGKLSKNAEAGKEIFERVGCINCHDGEYYTNQGQYNLGLGKGKDAGKKFDTPTLIELWRTAPYLHDGRAATVKEAILMLDEASSHKMVNGLSEDELNKLVEYCLSL